MNKEELFECLSRLSQTNNLRDGIDIKKEEANIIVNEIERLKKELEIEKDISDGMLETIDKAIEYIESNPLVCIYDTYLYVTDIEQLEKGIPDLKFFKTLKEILKKEENNESSNINREIN